jgi:hypothetical protein
VSLAEPKLYLDHCRRGVTIRPDAVPEVGCRIYVNVFAPQLFSLRRFGTVRNLVCGAIVEPLEADYGD